MSFNAHMKKSLKTRILLFFFVKLPLAFVLLTVSWVFAYKWLPVYVTPLMIQRSIENRKDSTYTTKKIWKPYSEISPELAKAVIASEDNLFNKHNGFDFKAIQDARKEYESGKRKYLRGASTISQQTAKNVFLLPHRSYLRKGLEAYFTVLIEKIWGKERIMEVYLNVIEMGPGIFGAEAAAQAHFGHEAAKLTNREACLIAACLPNPVKRSAGHPSSYISKRAGDIAALEKKLAYPDWVLRK